VQGYFEYADIVKNAIQQIQHTAEHSSSERSERFVRFEPNVRSERVRYFSERETNVQALKRLKRNCTVGAV